MATLMNDEKNIVWWLLQYGPLPRRQIERFLYNKKKQTVGKIIRNLNHMNYVTEVGGGYYIALNRQDTPNQRTILALWVLLHFIESIAPLCHAPTEFPSSVFFLKDNIGYEIVVLLAGEQHHIRLLQIQPDTKYIFVIPTIEMAKELAIPDVPHLFATVDWCGHEDPEVMFYQEEDIANDL